MDELTISLGNLLKSECENIINKVAKDKYLDKNELQDHYLKPSKALRDNEKKRFKEDYTKWFLEKRRFLSEDSSILITDEIEAIDIDSEFDFEYAEWLLSQKYNFFQKE